MIQAMILQISYLDILQTDQWLVPFLKNLNVDNEGNLLEEDPLNEYYENSGFSSTSMLINLGSTFVYILALAGLMLIHLLLKLLARSFKW